MLGMVENNLLIVLQLGPVIKGEVGQGIKVIM
jgi:hypothetical protein